MAIFPPQNPVVRLAGNRSHLLFLMLLLAGASVRIIGIDRGRSEFHPPGRSAPAFYHFHPDENLVVDAALAPFTPANPPITGYGMLPSYLLRGAMEAAVVLAGWDEPDLSDPRSEYPVFRLARLLAAIYSIGTLCIVWVLGKKLFGSMAALVAVGLVAFAPGAIQQSQFHIVDGLFLFLSTSAALLIADSLRSQSALRFAALGIVIGLTAAVRLNGALLGLVLLLGYMVQRRSGPLEQACPGARHRWSLVVVAASSAMATLLLVQPNLLANPGALWKATGTPDFGLTIRVASGELLQPWTLVDVPTLPFLFHWTDLFPLAVGWPATISMLAGIGYALWKRSVAATVILFWCAVHYLLIGGLHTKPVRYLIPMLPLLALLAGQLLSNLSRARRWGGLVAALLLAHVAFYGIAFARVYTERDSRLQAADWLQRHAPPGASIGVERGGFSMRALVSERRFEAVDLDISRIFHSAPYSLCAERMQHLKDRLGAVDYLVIIDANRYAQFTAVPDLFPVAAAFYRRLTAERLGFELVAEFKSYPRLFGIRWQETGAEPSFIGYDHPKVWIFAREVEVFDAALGRWTAAAGHSSACADGALRSVAEALNEQRPERALELVDSTLQRFPHSRVAHLLAWEAHRRTGDDGPASGAWQRYLPEYSSDGMGHVISSSFVHQVPGSTAISLARLDLGELALEILDRGARDAGRYDPRATASMAKSYVRVARYFFERDELAMMEAALLHSLAVQPTEEALKILALRPAAPAALDAALERWEQSRSPGEAVAPIHREIGLALRQQPAYRSRANYHLSRAVQLDPTLDGAQPDRPSSD